MFDPILRQVLKQLQKQQALKEVLCNKMFQNPFNVFVTGTIALMKHHLRRSVLAITILLGKIFQIPFAD